MGVMRVPMRIRGAPTHARVRDTKHKALMPGVNAGLCAQRVRACSAIQLEVMVAEIVGQ